MQIFDIVKNKTNILGYWKDSKGKIYKDNISLFDCSFQFDIDSKLKQLFESGEKAVFIKTENCGFVYHENIFTLPEILPFRHVLHVPKNSFSILKSVYITFKKSFSGFTVYKSKEGYTFEAWTK